MSNFRLPFRLFGFAFFAWGLAALPAAAQPFPPRPVVSLPAWSAPVPMGGVRTVYRDKPECLVSAQSRIDCFVLADGLAGDPASGDTGAVFRATWDGASWSAWSAASPAGFAVRDAAHRGGKPGRAACMPSAGGLVACYLVANFAPSALPQNADVRLAGGIFGSSGRAAWWGDLGTPVIRPGPGPAGAPVCLATPNGTMSCAVYARTGPLTGAVFTRLLSNGLWGPWSEAFDGGDAPFWSCAARSDGRIDCIVSSRSVDPATRRGTPFLRHVVYDPQGALAGYQPGPDLGAAIADIASDPQCVNAPDQISCFVLADAGTGVGALPARLTLEHRPGAAWTFEPIGFRQTAGGTVFSAGDIADFDCSTGGASNDIDCVVALRSGRLARYSKTAAQELDWRLIDTQAPMMDRHEAISCKLSADGTQKHCFAVSSGGGADPARLRFITLDSILPRLRPLRPIRVPGRPVVVPGRPTP